MKKVLKISAFLLLLFWVGTASAAYALPEIAKNDHSMQYLHYIFGDVGGLFSGWNSNLAAVDTAAGTTILGIMFQQFNYGISVLAIFIFAYIYGKGILDTAAEGQFLGKKGNSLWVPLRGILGLILLVPTAAGGGYNVAQIFVMWIVMQGIALADTVWGVAAYAMSEGQGITQEAGQDLTAIGSEYEYQQTITRIFQSLVCAYAAQYELDSEFLANGQEGETVTPELRLIEPSSDGTYANGVQIVAGRYMPGKAKPFAYINCGMVTWKNMQVAVGESGSVKYKKYSSISTTNLQGGLEFRQRWGGLIERLVNLPPGSTVSGSDLSKLAENYVVARAPDVVGGDPVPWATDASSEAGQAIWAQTTSGNPMKEALDDYTQTVGKNDLGNGYLDWLANQLNNDNIAGSDSGDFSVVGKYVDDGWLMAGSYYSTFKDMRPGDQGGGTATAAMLELPDPTKDSGGMGESKDPKYKYITAPYKAAGDYANSMMTGQAPAAESDSDATGPNTNKLDTTGSRDHFERFILAYGYTAAAVTYIVPSLIMWAGPGAALVPAIIGLIIIIVTATSMLYAIVHSTAVDPIYLLSIFGNILLITASVIYIAAVAVTWSVGLGSSFGQCVSGFANAYTSTTFITSMSVLIVVASMVAFGSMLSVYLPMLYFIYFSIAAIFWFMVIVELMIIVVIGVLGLMMPEGQHDVWGMAQPTVMLILNAYLRPVMMVIGLIAASYISVVAIRLISAGFYDAMIGATYGGAMLANPLVVILYMMLYIMLCITAVTTPLKLITSIPDVCMSGISGFTGAGIAQRMDQASGEVKGALTKGAGATGASMGAKGKQAKQGAEKKKKTDAGDLKEKP